MTAAWASKQRGFRVPRAGWLLLILIPLSAWLAWRWGRIGQNRRQPPSLLRVTGASMAPTLLGESVTARCDACNLRWPRDPVPRADDTRVLVCPHCGGPMDGKHDDEVHRGDVVSLADVPPDRLARGDLVAMDWGGQMQVKRLVGLPGDTIGLDGIRLQIDGRRLDDVLTRAAVPLPHFLVDLDRCRRQSRWSPMDGSTGWQRSPDGRGWSGRGYPGWLIYHHRNIYRDRRPSPVHDDYPFNVGMSRMLFPVDRLTLRGRLDGCESATIEVAFWTRDGPRLARVKLVNQRFDAACHDAVAATDLPVAAPRPVAIRVRCTEQSWTLLDLSIQRLIEYRVRPHDDRSGYPQTIGPGRCFVLGDNVPVSIDSRDFGPVPINCIVGVVRDVKREEEHTTTGLPLAREF